MKSPAELQFKLRRQWDDNATREARLLAAGDAWPVVMPIGRPAAKLMHCGFDAVARHVQAWRQVEVGEVIWKPVRYRAAATPVEVPVEWKLRQPSEWLRACGDCSMRAEFEKLALFVEQTDPLFHRVLIRNRSLWRDRQPAEVVQAARLALALTPGCAGGRPLRMISLAGIDTKFFERNRHLITVLLDVRYDDEVSHTGLEAFLGAAPEGEHWLLVVDLDGGLLPFRKLQVRSSELQQMALPGKRLLIVENLSCQHQIPDTSDTVAVLGTGFDLGWMNRAWLRERQVGYWGDIDTWGLKFLAEARAAVPRLEPLMMSAAVYEQYARFAVPEPVAAGRDLPAGLSESEQALYTRLLNEPRGRLEQEFLPENHVQQAVFHWASREPVQLIAPSDRAVIPPRNQLA